MKCVSYTRTTSCLPGAEIQEKPITIQNENIKAYAKKRGWKIIGRYSDRKNDPTEIAAFLQMRKDGMDGKFECVIINSISQCGKDTFEAVRLFEQVFYPTGIHVAIVDEDFCSADLPRQEVESYFQMARNRQRSLLNSQIMMNYSRKHRVDYYGYRYLRDENRLVIDEEVGPVVVEIFTLLSQGKTCGEVANVLNARKEETPMFRKSRLDGWARPALANEKWTDAKVIHIARNRHYLGHWHVVVDGEDIGKDCPGLISEELFEKAQTALKARSTYQGHTLRIYPFRGMVFDKDSGFPLSFHMLHQKNDMKVVRFKYPKPRPVFYDKPYMEYDDFEKQVQELLILERAKARSIEKMIFEKQGMEYREKMMHPVKAEAMSMIKQLSANEMRMLQIQKNYDEGMLLAAEYEEDKKLNRDEQTKLFLELEEVMQRLTDIDTAYTVRNPWLQLFLNYDESASFTSKEAQKYFVHVDISRFEKVMPVFQHEYWRDVLPPQWLQLPKGGF